MAKAKNPAETKPCRALVPVHYDDERFEPGHADPIDVRVVDLDQLLAVKAVEVVEAPAPEPKAKP